MTTLDTLIDSNLAFRKLLIKLTQDMTDSKLDTIAAGFNNSIRWQLAHVVVTPLLLSYGLAGLEKPLVSQAFIDSARKDTTPADLCKNEDFSLPNLHRLLLEIPEKMRKDFKANPPKEFKNYATSTGYVLSDLFSAISYSNIHDGIHLGNIMALKKILV